MSFAGFVARVVGWAAVIAAGASVIAYADELGRANHHVLAWTLGTFAAVCVGVVALIGILWTLDQ